MTDDKAAATIVYSPGEVAQRLGISTAMLRRHAGAYQQVYDDLVRDARDGYRYTDVIVSRLEQALTAVWAGHVQSVKEGLERLSEGVGLPEAYEPQPEPLHVVAEALRALQGEIQALRGEVAGLREDNAGLREDNGMLREQLKALTAPSDTPSGHKAEYVAETEQIHTNKDLEEERKRVKELNRRIEYLQRELERRSTDSQQVKRPWWRRVFG